MDDSRAAIRQDWDIDGLTIQKIELGRVCGVVDEMLADNAIQHVELSMQNELANASLLGDPSMSIRKTAEKFIQVGKSSAQIGACSVMTPAVRGHLRSMIEALAH